MNRCYSTYNKIICRDEEGEDSVAIASHSGDGIAIKREGFEARKNAEATNFVSGADEIR